MQEEKPKELEPKQSFLGKTTLVLHAEATNMYAEDDEKTGEEFESEWEEEEKTIEIEENEGEDYEFEEDNWDDGYGLTRRRSICCTFHCPEATPMFVSRRYNRLMEEQKVKTEELKKQFSIVILGEKVEMNKNEIVVIVVTDKHITFGSKIPNINFAACWNDDFDPMDYIKTEKIDVPVYSNIHPIPYTISEKGYHLKIELFHNNFVRRDEKEIRNYTRTKYSHQNHYNYYSDY